MSSEGGLSSPAWLWRDFVFNNMLLSTVLTDSKPQVMDCSCIFLHCENLQPNIFWGSEIENKMLPFVAKCLKADCSSFLKQKTKKTYKCIKKLICVSSLMTH